MLSGATPDESSSVGEVDLDNVYLREFLGLTRQELAVAAGYEAWLRAPGGPSAFERRVACVRRYAFGVPNRAALDGLARHAPIVELGAGTGYWAYLLRNRGVQVVAYDVAPPGQGPNDYKFEPRTWTPVQRGGVEVLDRHPSHALFLCWPGYRDTFAEQALARFAGAVLVYVGEGPGGNTANAAFFDCLRREWRMAQQIVLPRWPGATDCLRVYYRRSPLSPQ